jgi:hypothetical protein
VNAPVVGFGLLFAAGSLVVAGSRRWNAALPTMPVSTYAIPLLHESVAVGFDDSLAVAEEWIVSNDPFRVANAPTTVRYDPGTDGVQSKTGAPVTPQARPTFVLKAIVGGPPWQAIVDGIPGQPAGTVVRVGNVFDKLSIRAITRDSVVIKGPDTTWSLTFRSPP